MYRALEVMYELLDKFALVLQLCVNFANALNPGGRQIDMFQLGAFSKFYELKCTENPRVSCLHCVIALMTEEDVKALLDRVVTRCIERAAELRWAEGGEFSSSRVSAAGPIARWMMSES
ncbi:hypothetical protein FOZ62_020112 [Perkinsus olseni]|uniref:Uncharacterized protein n=1 Tax=Perkinsus olseni TaxID=32597 RepID=A0A7J6TCD5_PEROL|nr:hypothetical protein FOZ62_020112 [Perkinsus olseni]